MPFLSLFKIQFFGVSPSSRLTDEIGSRPSRVPSLGDPAAQAVAVADTKYNQVLIRPMTLIEILGKKLLFLFSSLGIFQP